jgi:hypothetical protein
VKSNEELSGSRAISRRELRLSWLHDVVWCDGEKYLERWILDLHFCSLRLHKFWSGDEPPVHDHPFWFVTVPLRTYREHLIDGSVRRVRAFVPHFRRATHAHLIAAPDRPFYTLVITGRHRRTWGFWETPERWVPWSDRVRYLGVDGGEEGR